MNGGTSTWCMIMTLGSAIHSHQAELYQRIIRKYKQQNFTPVDVYLIGNKISDEAKEIVDLRKWIHIKTYQDFLDNCRKRYQEYLNVVES